jgi:hypothetical protein
MRAPHFKRNRREATGVGAMLERNRKEGAQGIVLLAKEFTPGTRSISRCHRHGP